MPMPKGYKHKKPRSEEHRKKISESQMGENNSFYNKYHSKETKRKISAAGKGKRKSEEHKRKLSEALKGKTIPEEVRRKMSEGSKGRHHSEKAKRKMSEVHKGEKNPMFGKHHSEEYRRKKSKTYKDENNPNWKGGRITYYALIAHRIWEDFWREMVPKGYAIHHIDEDRTNNHISNLVCMPIGEHTSLHAKRRKEARRSHDFTNEFQSQAC